MSRSPERHLRLIASACDRPAPRGTHRRFCLARGPAVSAMPPTNAYDHRTTDTNAGRPCCTDLEATLARAKRTGRAEARRRYRAAMGEPEPLEGDVIEEAEAP